MVSNILMALIVVGIVSLVVWAQVADPIREQTVVVDGIELRVGVHTNREVVSVGDLITRKDIFRKGNKIKTLVRIGSRWGTFSSVQDANEEEALLFRTVFTGEVDTL